LSENNDKVITRYQVVINQEKLITKYNNAKVTKKDLYEMVNNIIRCVKLFFDRYTYVFEYYSLEKNTSSTIKIKLCCEGKIVYSNKDLELMLYKSLEKSFLPNIFDNISYPSITQI
jgi:hypothetical protein